VDRFLIREDEEGHILIGLFVPAMMFEDMEKYREFIKAQEKFIKLYDARNDLSVWEDAFREGE